MRWILILLLIVVPGGLAAQKRPAKKPAAPNTQTAVPNKWPIASISIEGNREYAKDTIIAATGLKIGQLAGKEEFEAARDRLVSSGLFETVGYRFAPAAGGKGYTATFQVTEVEPLYPVRFERLGATSDELTALLKGKDPFFGPRIPPTQAILDRYAKAIEEYLTSKSRPEKVIGRVAPEPNGDLAVYFRPSAPLPVVAQVKFQGNQVIPSQALLNAFSGVAYGTPFTEDGFRQLLDAQVRPLYDARGRLNVSFPKITAEKAADVQGLVVTVVVDEGSSYNLGDVKIANASAISARELLDVAKFKSGDLANFTDVNAGLDRIRKRYRREGYLQVEARIDRKLNNKTKTADLIVRVDEGPQFLFSKLNIEGLDLHGEAAIRKLWALKEGKPFNADYPEYFLSRVREDGIFDSLGKTRASTNIDEKTRTVDVTLSFGAAPPPPDSRKKRPY